MNRREAILSTGGMVVAASLSALACAAQNAVAAGAASPSPPTPAPTPAAGAPGAADAALDCVKKGLACRSHCIGMLSSGDTSMAECIAAVLDMLAATEALAAVASAGTKRTAAAARFALEACTDCEAACRKHADQHVVCRECADSCAKTIAACKTLV